MFKKLIMNQVLGVIWVIGTISITVAGIVALGLAGEHNQRSIESFRMVLYGLAVLVIGNLLWRLVCESLVVLFKIHDFLSDINETLKVVARQDSKV